MSSKGKTHRRDAGATAPTMRPSDDNDDTTPQVTANPKYKPTREAVMRIVEGLARKRRKRKRKGDEDLFVTLGTVSRAVDPDAKWLLEFVIKDLADDGIIAYNTGGLRTRIWAA